MDLIEGRISGFLSDWENKEFFIGAILTGSWAVGMQTKYSDIDLLLVLDESVDWKQRGNERIDGMLVEYIAYPADEWTRVLNAENNSGTRMWSVMWSVGKIIKDKSGAIQGFVDLAKKIRQSPIRKLSGDDLEMAKYQLYDGLENLQDLNKEKSPSFLPAYFLQLAKITGSYSGYLGVSLPANSKLAKYFSSDSYRQAYGLTEFPDKTFETKLLDCMSNPNFPAMQDLSEYTIEKLGGFEIDGWVLRTRK